MNTWGRRTIVPSFDCGTRVRSFTASCTPSTEEVSVDFSLLFHNKCCCATEIYSGEDYIPGPVLKLSWTIFHRLFNLAITPRSVTPELFYAIIILFFARNIFSNSTAFCLGCRLLFFGKDRLEKRLKTIKLKYCTLETSSSLRHSIFREIVLQFHYRARHRFPQTGLWSGSPVETEGLRRYFNFYNAMHFGLRINVLVHGDQKFLLEISRFVIQMSGCVMGTTKYMF